MKNTISMKKLERMTSVIKYFVLFFFGIVLMAPFVWMISVGFDRTANIVMPFPPRLIPEANSSFN